MNNDPCLQCSLPICDDKSPRCAFVIIRREAGRANKSEPRLIADKRGKSLSIRWAKRRVNDRREYWRNRYQNSRTREAVTAQK